MTVTVKQIPMGGLFRTFYSDDVFIRTTDEHQNGEDILCVSLEGFTCWFTLDHEVELIAGKAVVEFAHP